MKRVAIVGGGPAGLIAAERLMAADIAVTVYDAMPSVGRKFLMAGKGGLNLTHSEPLPAFVARYGTASPQLAPMLAQFGADALRAWAHGLGINTFVGSSGRVFPDEMKAAPLLRAWLHRLRAGGVRFAVRHRWSGWAEDGVLRFSTPEGPLRVRADAVLLALGGGSWAKLGSDGAWLPWLADRGVAVAPLRPANCGFDVPWSAYFRERFAGAAVKNVIGRVGDRVQPGEFNITQGGIEGGLVYALSAPLRDALDGGAAACLTLDLAPGRSAADLSAALGRPRGRDSLSNHLRRRAGIEGVKAALLRECLPPGALGETASLVAGIKALPLAVAAPRPLDEAISSAGGVCLSGLDAHLMLAAMPGVFCAGEMLDWEAPTGGYLLTGCFASGVAAAAGILHWLQG